MVLLVAVTQLEAQLLKVHPPLVQSWFQYASEACAAAGSVDKAIPAAAKLLNFEQRGFIVVTSWMVLAGRRNTMTLLGISLAHRSRGPPDHVEHDRGVDEQLNHRPENRLAKTALCDRIRYRLE